MNFKIHKGSCIECLKNILDESVHLAVTSPPYFNLRDYGIEETEWPEFDFSPMPDLPKMTIPAMKCCHGSEKDIWAYVGHEVLIFRELRKKLRKDGSLWLNLGDTYAANRTYQVSDSKHTDVGNSSGMAVPSGLKQKDMMGIPWRVAYALQADGWWLRSCCDWLKVNSMPESCQDRPSVATETWFLLTKSADYYYDIEAVRKPHSDVSINRVKRPFHLTQEVKERSVNSAEDGDMTRFCHPNGRNRKNTDGWLESVDAIYEWAKTCKENIESKNRGMVSNIEGEPLAIISPTAQFKGAHFATFAENLIEPMILSGTSEKGNCPDCGTPWVRIMEKVGHFQRRWTNTNLDGSPYSEHGNNQNIYECSGWRPQCGCYDETYDSLELSKEERLVVAAPDEWKTVPSIVLDPFSGSGTTGIVSLKNGRNYIGCEIGQQYVDMSTERLENTVKEIKSKKTISNVLKNPEKIKKQPVVSGMKSLFGNKI